MQPAGRRSVVDVALRSARHRGRAGAVAVQGARAAAARRSDLSRRHARCRDRRSAPARRRDRRADRRLAAGAADLRLRVFRQSELESGHREIRRAGADLRHHRHLAHRDADRGPDRPADRVLPDRAVPAVAAPPDRHRDRAARRHSQHHLRHLGPVRLRPVPAGHLAAVPDQHLRQRAGARRRCSPARPTASAC